MIYKVMDKADAIQDIFDSVNGVFKISRKDLNRAAIEIVDEMFGNKETLTSDEYLEARGNLTKGMNENSTDTKDWVKFFAAYTIPELDLGIEELEKLFD